MLESDIRTKNIHSKSLAYKNNEKELRSDFPDYAIMQCLDSSEILQYSIYIFYDSEIIRKIPKLEFL